MRSDFPTIAIAVILATAPAAAQPAVTGPPTSLSALAAKNQEYTPADLAKIEAWARAYTSQLASRDPAKVGEAYDKLNEPLDSSFEGIPTLNFRSAYGRVLLPALRPILADHGKHQAALNAIQLVGSLATREALDMAVAHCDLRNEDRLVIRMWAARGIRTTLEESGEDIALRDRAAAVRALGDAVQRETDYRAVQWQLDTIAHSNLTVTEDVLLSSLDNLLDRMARQPEASGFMFAIRQTISDLQGWFIKMDEAGQTRFMKTMTPRLVRILEIAKAHSETVEQRPQCREFYLNTIDKAERLLGLIDDTTADDAIGDTRFSESYTARDYKVYSDQLDHVQSVIKSPPYK